MQRVYCHSCSRQFSISSQNWDGSCPSCGEGFVEVTGQGAAISSDSPGRNSEYQTSFHIPGGIGTVHVVYGSGPHLTGVSGHFPSGSVGPTADPFELLRALLGDNPFGGQDQVFGGFGSDYNQEHMDRIITQIMNQYQPQTRETSRRVRNCLPRLQVRSRNSKTTNQSGDCEMGTATVCAGEPCSVCHDEFEEGKEVVELPCNHCFHEDCLMPWLEEHNTCPICRLELPIEQDNRNNQHQQDSASARRPATVSEDTGTNAGHSGYFNQLLHNIAERWQMARDEADDRAETSNTFLNAIEQSPQDAAARAAMARATATSSDQGRSNHSSSRNGRSAANETHEHSHSQGIAHGSDSGERMQLGMAVGGALAALAGAAVSAFMGRNRQSRDSQ